MGLASFGTLGNSISSIVGGIKLLFQGLLLVGVLGGMVYFIMRMIRYNVEVEVYSPRVNGSFKVFKDRGGFIKTKNGKVFKLLKRKIEVPCVDIRHIFASGKKNYIKLVETSPDELVPANVMIDERNVKILPEQIDIKMYRQQRFLRNQQQWNKQDAIQRFMPVILIAVPTVLMIIMLYVVTKDMTSMASSLSSAASAFKSGAAGAIPG